MSCQNAFSLKIFMRKTRKKTHGKLLIVADNFYTSNLVIDSVLKSTQNFDYIGTVRLNRIKTKDDVNTMKLNEVKEFKH